MENEKSITSVLIVDDSPIIWLFLEQLFLSEGCDVVTAETGEEAVEYFKKRVFDVAFIDIRLTGMNGLETYKEMLKINPKTKAIMMTAYATDEIIDEAVKLGVVGCLRKPFGIDEALQSFNKLKK
ncbi:MAG: response regulator [Elusimicrobia bacterium]|nr:response regulator [Elusimicrobiota bacterium]